MLDKSKEVCKKAIELYGKEHQTVVAIEEYSEVQKELCKFLRGIGSKEHLVEELADRGIVDYQIMEIYGISKEEVHEVMDKKIDRLAERLKYKELMK